MVCIRGLLKKYLHPISICGAFLSFLVFFFSRFSLALLARHQIKCLKPSHFGGVHCVWPTFLRFLFFKKNREEGAPLDFSYRLPIQLIQQPTVRRGPDFDAFQSKVMEITQAHPHGCPVTWYPHHPTPQPPQSPRKCYTCWWKEEEREAEKIH